MRRYILRRLLIAIPILLGVSIVTFIFANLAPGDPVSALFRPGSDIRGVDIEKLKAALGLDKPFLERYVVWLTQILQGNLGVSFISKLSVAGTLSKAIPNTLMLMVDGAHGQRDVWASSWASSRPSGRAPGSTTS